MEFYVEISNASNSAIRILKIDASISSETGTCPLDEIGTSSKYLSIAPSTSISLRFVKLLCEIGEQTYYSYLSLSLLTPSVHISLTYNNSLTDFVVLEEYRFQSLKPFDIAFSRTQLSHNRFIVNSTITNRLATDMMLTNVAFSVASSRVRQVYTSFDS